MLYLRQSTAVTLKIGPFLDEDDGKTQETALTISQADVRLSKNGAGFAQKNESSSCSHDEAGWYSCSLNPTDTNTAGRLLLAVHESGALPVWCEFMVVPINVYDSIVAGTDALQVDTIQVSGTVQTANDVGADVDAILADTGTDGVVLVDGGVTAAKIATDAIGANELAADAIAEIAAAVNAEVVDALTVDTYPEPGQGAPPATASLVTKTNYLYKGFRNKWTSTASGWSLFNDAEDTVDQKASVSDNGTTLTRGEVESGP